MGPHSGPSLVPPLDPRAFARAAPIWPARPSGFSAGSSSVIWAVCPALDPVHAVGSVRLPFPLRDQSLHGLRSGEMSRPVGLRWVMCPIFSPGLNACQRGLHRAREGTSPLSPRQCPLFRALLTLFSRPVKTCITSRGLEAGPAWREVAGRAVGALGGDHFLFGPSTP